MTLDIDRKTDAEKNSLKQDPSLLLYSLNYSPELTGIGKYNGEMIEWSANKGEQVEVVCAAPYYPEWQVHDGYSSLLYRTIQDERVRVTHCPHYVPKRPTSIKRLLHLISFALTSSLPLLLTCLLRRPRVLMVVQPTLFCTPFTLLLCKLLGIKSLLHVQDFEVDAMFGLGMAKSGEKSLIAKLAFKVESFLLKSFDAVSTISHSMMAKAEAKGVDPDKLLFFPNWSDTEFVHPNVSGRDMRAEWQVEDHEKVVLYAGNIGAKQGLELLLEAAEAYLDKPNVKFFVVGSGAYKAQLEQLAIAKGLTNVQFKPLQAWEKVPAMLAMADVHLVIQKKGVADAVLPSKLTNILSAGGHAVVTAEAETELGRIAQKYSGIYSCVKPEDLESFLQGLEHELALSSRDAFNVVARRYAEAHLNRDAILKQFWLNLDVLVDGSIRTTSEKG